MCLDLLIKLNVTVLYKNSLDNTKMENGNALTMHLSEPATHLSLLYPAATCLFHLLFLFLSETLSWGGFYLVIYGIIAQCGER